MARRHEALIPLSHDHQQALALAFRLHHPAPPGPVTPTTPASTPESRREEALAFFAAHLVGHFEIEEEILFPALRAGHPVGSSMHGLLDDLLDDHREFRRLREALQADAEQADLAALLTSFADLLEAHVRREERELFASFPGELDARSVGELQRAVHARRPPDRRGAR
jgi:iron-sulfur cluster repair protein YtfE (RIC family)